MAPLDPAPTRRLIKDVADVTEASADDRESIMERVEDEVVKLKLSVDLQDLATILKSAIRSAEYYDKLDDIDDIVSTKLNESVGELAQAQDSVQGQIEMKNQKEQKDIEAIAGFLSKYPISATRAISDPQFQECFGKATETRLEELLVECAEIRKQFRAAKDDVLELIRKEYHIKDLERTYKTYSDLARAGAAKAERESALDKEKLSEVQEELANQKSIVRQRDATISELRRQLESANTEFQNGGPLVQQRDATISELQGQAQLQQTAYDTLQSEFEDKKQTLAVLQKSLEHEQYSIKLQRGIIDENAAAKKDRDALAAEKEALAVEKGSIKSTLEEEVRVAGEQIRTLASSNEQVTKDLSDKTIALESLQEQLTAATEDRSSLEQTKRDLDATVLRNHSQIQSLEEQLNAAKNDKGK
ncbi:MAG: hypothetical protein Q9207_005542 [Kuettlingeria erythrocarpa]